MSGRRLDLDILMNDLAIESHAHEACVGDLLAAGIKAWSLKNGFKCLPSPRRPRGIGSRRDALVQKVIGRFKLGPRIDAAAIARCRVLDAPAVKDLDFIQPFELDAGVRAFGNEKLELHLEVAEFLFAYQ